ncbi:MAG: hypothetical protein ABSG37_11075 [Candidatus Limnocylindrales bacterium]|jgi:hypothetical protein
MSSIHRTGLTIAAATAALTMAGAVAVQGYSSSQIATAPNAGAQGARVAAADASAAPSLEPEIVYVNPAPTPAIITVTQTAPPVSGRAGAAGPQTIHVVVPGHAGGDDHNGGHNQGGGDD